MSFRYIAGAVPPCGPLQTTLDSSAFLPIPQLDQAAHEDLVTYPIVTAGSGHTVSTPAAN